MIIKGIDGIIEFLGQLTREYVECRSDVETDAGAKKNFIVTAKKYGMPHVRKFIEAHPNFPDLYETSVSRSKGKMREKIFGLPPKRRIGLGVLELLGASPLFAAAPLYRRRYMRWGATDEEVSVSMVGDEIVPGAPFKAARAITIDAPPEEVWPWIVQMGYGRAGFYAYDLVGNGGYPSADRILAEYQNVGIELPLSKDNAFRVKKFEVNRWLLWGKPDNIWSLELKLAPEGKTRLILRICARPANLFWKLFMEFHDPPMARRMLKGIKSRAEKIAGPCRQSGRGRRPRRSRLRQR
jgi:hypothetical protein